MKRTWILGIVLSLLVSLLAGCAPYTCKNYSIVYSDGVIVIIGFSTSLPLYVWYFTPALQPLF